MGGLLRTTSRSESENSFFNNFMHPYLTLVEFWLRFDKAMDAQRNAQRKLESESIGRKPDKLTPLALENHAAEVYTLTIFYEFQREVYGACFSICVIEMRICGDEQITTLKEDRRPKAYQVMFNPHTHKSSCSCKMFERMGLVCRHIVWF